MESGIASTILFFYPILVTLIMAIFFKEKITWATITSIMLAFVGIGLLYKGDKGMSLSMFGIFIVFLSALAYALYIVGVNKTRVNTMDGDKLTFYALLVGSGIFFIKLGFGANLEMISGVASWFDIIMLALVPTVVSCVAMVWAVHNVGSTVTAHSRSARTVNGCFCGYRRVSRTADRQYGCRHIHDHTGRDRHYCGQISQYISSFHQGACP